MKKQFVMGTIFLVFGLSLVSFFFAEATYGQSTTPSPTPVVVASPSPTSTPSASPTATPANLISTTQNLVNKIPSTIPAWVLAVIAFLVELSMRFWPTVQPRSLLLLAGNFFGAIGIGFTKISALLDLVVQNIKDPTSLT